MNWSITFNQVSGRLGDATGRNYVRKHCTTMLFRQKKVWPFDHGSTKILQPKASFAQVRPFWQATLIRKTSLIHNSWFLHVSSRQVVQNSTLEDRPIVSVWKVLYSNLWDEFYPFSSGIPQQCLILRQVIWSSCYWFSIHQHPQSQKNVGNTTLGWCPLLINMGTLMENPFFWW